MKKEFSGNLKEAIIEMLESDTDCCTVTNTVNDISVTVDITITKIVDKGEVVYDAYEDEEEQFLSDYYSGEHIYEDDEPVILS